MENLFSTTEKEMLHISILFQVLNNYLFLCISIGSYHVIRELKAPYLVCMIGLHSIVNFAFLVKHLLIFFISFEFIVLPMYFIIITWGNRK